ncbi:hypothetical protein GCM10022212_22970 [Actimicrobium antarcticum]|uniref:Tyr recombinase domain-containing protein n=2 Tax=Actimicrobium antarcticum TaxID=1051899 RepID=A0ABP7TEH5_9BURK
MDIKKLLEDMDTGSIRTWRAAKLTLPNGTVVENVDIADDEDQTRFNTFLAATGASASPTVVIAKSQLLSACIDDFLTERKSGLLSDKNLADYNYVLRRILLDLCGDQPIDDLGIQDANRVVKALQAWPSNATKNPALKNLNAERTMQEAAMRKLPLIGPRTCEKYLDRLRSFFTWAKDAGHWTKSNPFAKRRTMTKEKRGEQQKRPFEDDDLTRIFDPALRTHHSDDPHKFWGPLIALFSGARVNEIAQLYIENIQQIGAVWVIKFTDDHDDQRLKNAASKRVVPLHRKLIELGFLEYVEDVKRFGFPRLFPNLPYSRINGYGDAIGDWFNGRYLRSAAAGSKVPRAGIDDPKKTFHSFRYVVINRLYCITNKKTLIAEITGHERGSDVLTNIYITPSEAKEREATMNLLDYPFLSFANYVPGQYSGFFKRLKRK